MSQKQSRIHIKRAKKYQSMGALSSAVDEYQKALSLDQMNIDAVNGLAELAVRMDMLDTALQWYDILVNIYPKNMIRLNRAKVLTKMGRNDEALFSYIELESDMSNNPIYLIGFGSLLLNMRKLEEAIEKFQLAEKRGANAGSCYNNIALANLYLSNFIEADEYFSKAAKKLKNDVQLQFNWASCMIQMGNIADGWEKYKYRYHPKFPTAPRWETDVPWWKGEDLKNKTLIISYEQGIGDMIIFATCLREMIPRAGKIILEVHDKLFDLFEYNFPEVKVRKANHNGIHIDNNNRTVFNYEWLNDENIKPDYFTILGDVFALCRQDYKDFPVHGSFLKPNKARKEEIVEILKNHNIDELPLVGLSWRSSFMSGTRNSGYCTDKEYSNSIGNIKKQTAFVNLQYAYSDEEIERLSSAAIKHGHIFINLKDVDLYENMVDTCALISSLDYVVAPNNTQYAFASALGVPNLTYGQSLFTFGFKSFDLVFPNSLRGDATWEDNLNLLLGGEKSFADLLYEEMKLNGDLDRFVKLYGMSDRKKIAELLR